MMSDAVADNVSAIRGELPPEIRPLRRFQQHADRWGPRASVVAVSVGVVLALTGVARRQSAPPSTTQQLEGGRSAAVAWVEAVSDSTSAVSTNVGDALSRTVNPGVLELGVRRVVIDAGHGGENLGTASASGLREKDLTLDIAERTRDTLVAQKFEVVMTRTSDASVSLQERAALANAKHGDIFVSIHLNSLQPASAKGIETFYLGPSDDPEHDAIAAKENQHSGYSLSDMRSLLERIYADARRDESRRLAEAVQHSMVRTMRQVDPELTNRGVKMAPFVVLVATEMPAILAEVACLSNAGEAERLNTPGYRQTLAEALAAGILAFANRPAVRTPASKHETKLRQDSQTRNVAAERTGSSGS
jgi:N-acetylmuramoyl-L-alanine amidase